MNRINHEPVEVSRRSFLKGGAALSALAVAGAALGGCSPTGQKETDRESTGPMQAIATVDMDLPEAAPIAPLDPPNTWDDEVDLVVVGMGGGGIAASLYAAEKGVKVIALEKEGTTGGATRHACGWFTLPGGSQLQNDMGYAYPEYPFDSKKFIRAIQPYYNYTIEDKLLMQMAEKGAECEDWMVEHGAPFTCMGPLFLDSRVKNGIQPLGMKFLCDDFVQLAEDAGADIRTNTACEGLVMDGGRVVGVKTKASDGSNDERYIKADQGVILCTGSFGMNRDMLAKYCPTAFRTAVAGGPFPFATGECTRMALGAGADMTGIDSWCCWEAYPDRFHDGDGAFWTYHWDGSVILCRQPWLTIDKMGNRYKYYTNRTEEHPLSFGGDGDYINAATQLSRMGGHGYCIFDADYEAHVKITGNEGGFGSDRSPLTPERVEASGIDAEPLASLCSLDWREDANKAIERGDIKKSDTLEGLAEELGLDPAILKKAVDDWNDTCAKGSDEDSVYPYNPEWLIPIEKAPFYGARIGGGIGKTFAGPRVTPKLEVVDRDAHVIPGLYAHFMTAGGICGESTFNGTMFNTTIQGGNAMSWISGYAAAQSALNA